VKVSTRPDFFERIANHPRVFPAVSRANDPPIVLDSIWDKCIGLEFEGGGWVMVEQSPRVYEVHTLFLPKSLNIIQNAEQALSYMFPKIADILTTMIPVDLPHVKRLATRMGFKPTHREIAAWSRAHAMIDLDHFELPAKDYLERVSCL